MLTNRIQVKNGLILVKKQEEENVFGDRRKVNSVGLRVGTLNVGTMICKNRELAVMMQRRKEAVLCL